MIRLQRPDCPSTLVDKGPARLEALASAVEEGRALPDASGVYRAEDVREALRQAQSGKCALCEHPIGAAQPGEVEHHRPKAGVKQGEGEPLIKPGYWWLAVQWANLALACRACNSAKGNLYPLADPHQRACSPEDDLGVEEPLLLDPFLDEPSEHLAWVGHDLMPLTERGRATRAVCALDRPRLGEARMHRIREVRSMLCALLVFRERSPQSMERRQLEEQLPRLIGPAAPFRSCVLAACAQLIERL